MFLVFLLGALSLSGQPTLAGQAVMDLKAAARQLTEGDDAEALESAVAGIASHYEQAENYAAVLDSGRALLYTFYLKQADFQSLEDRLTEDVAFVRKHYDDLPEDGRDKTLDNLIIYCGYAAGRRGDYQRRKSVNEGLYHEVRQRPRPDTVRLASLTSRLAIDLMTLGDYDLAVDYATRGKQHWQSLSAEVRNGELPLLGSLLDKYIGDAHRLNGKHTSARSSYEQAVAALRAAQWREKRQYRARLVSCYQGMARSAIVREQFSEGRRHLQAAATIEEEFGAVSGRTLYLQGMLERMAGRLGDAEGLLQESLTGYDSEFINFRRAKSLMELGRVYTDDGRTEDALTQFQTALRNLAPGFDGREWCDNPANLDQLYPLKDALDVLREKSRALAVAAAGDRGRLECALETHRLAVGVLDRIKQGTDSDLVRSRTIAEYYGLFAEGIELAQQLDREDLMVELAEQSHSNQLLSAVLATRLPPDLLPEELRQRELSLKKDLDAARRAVARKASKGEVDSTVVANTTAARLALDEHYVELRQDFPEYYQLLRQVETDDYHLIQDGVGETMISFFVGEENSYGFLMRPDEEVFVYRIDVTRDRLTTLVTELLRAVYFGRPEENALAPAARGRVPRSQAEADALYADRAHRLYQFLMAPALEHAGGNPGSLLIVPHEILNYLPFDALLRAPVPEAETGIYGNSSYQYLARDFPISYAYSATLHRLMQEANGRSDQSGVLLFHGMDFSSQTSTIEEAFRDAGFSSDYVEVLDQAGSVATLAERGKDHQIIHFSVHGVVNGDDPAASYLALRPAEEPSDTTLSLSQLYRLDLPVEMVFTSACNAGVGRLYAGEGTLSLARGFAHAGSKSLITTLWAVSGGASDQLMGDFYRELGEGARKDEALFLAKKAMLQRTEYAAPYYWAGFIPVGDMAPLRAAGGGRWWVWALAALGISIGMGLLIRRNA